MTFPGPKCTSLTNHAAEYSATLRQELTQRGFRVPHQASVVRAVYALDLPYEVAATGPVSAVGLLVGLPKSQVWVPLWADDLHYSVWELVRTHGTRKGFDDTTARNLLRWGAKVPEDLRSVTFANLLDDLKATLAVGGRDAAKTVVKALSKHTRAPRNSTP